MNSDLFDAMMEQYNKEKQAMYMKWYFRMFMFTTLVVVFCLWVSLTVIGG